MVSLHLSVRPPSISLRRGFGHRKQWLENRLTELVAVFAVECAGFAVLDNHDSIGVLWSWTACTSLVSEFIAARPSVRKTKELPMFRIAVLTALVVLRRATWRVGPRC